LADYLDVKPELTGNGHKLADYLDVKPELTGNGHKLADYLTVNNSEQGKLLDSLVTKVVIIGRELRRQ
jgi:hypothetical protein